MDDRYYSISDAVFDRFPDYLRGVVIAYGVTNGPSPPDLVAMLRSAEASVRERVKPEELAGHPRIACWRDAFKRLGVNPNEFRPSVEAMARRVLKSQELPFISALVDIANVLSLRHLVPMGGHAIDVLTEDMALRPAGGEERFVPFGSTVEEHPQKGEFILAEGNTVLTRRWIWRQANHTLLLPTTTAVEVNVDCLPPVAEPEARTILGELQETLARFCGGSPRVELLTRAHPRLSLEP